MALPVNTFGSFDAVGNREDLSDAIYDISPMETPFVSNIPRVRAYAVSHEWQTDALAAATTQAYLEGDDATADAAIATVRLANETHIFRRVISVSGTQRAVRSAGRADEYEYQLGKRGREIKRNIEKALLGVQGRNAPASSATARQLAGVATWLSTNKIQAASSTTPGAGATMDIATTLVATSVAVLKAQVDTIIQQVWTAGGDPGTIMASGPTKAFMSDMVGIATLYRDVPSKMQAQIIAGADHYVSNFGNHDIVPTGSCLSAPRRQPVTRPTSTCWTWSSGRWPNCAA